MQNSEASKRSSRGQRFLASNKKMKQRPSAEATVCNDKSAALPVARNKPRAAARCLVTSGGCHIMIDFNVTEM